MTTWLLHRATGLLLIVLLGTKFLSGYFLLGQEKAEWALALHRQPVLDITLIFLFSLHVCFGLKTILFELGLRREKALVRGAVVVALAMSVVGSVFYFTAG